jgi:transcriptional regulator with XRE-family HTH domain
VATSASGESFRGLLLRHRGRTELTQSQLADRIGVVRRTVQDWESGVNYPRAGCLQGLIDAIVSAGGLGAEQEAAEAEALWTAAERESSRLYPPFDSTWFTHLLAGAGKHMTSGRCRPCIEFIDSSGRNLSHGSSTYYDGS